jgi:bifunctional DNA-binding transcriptional regulator/antitoxin component of YhaV-PrlF toxin-antitoxin module
VTSASPNHHILHQGLDNGKTSWYSKANRISKGNTMIKESVLSSKNQISIPRDIRKAKGLKAGDRIQYLFDEKTKQLVIEKADDIDSLRLQIKQFIEPGVEPVRDVSAYYRLNKFGAGE